MRPIIFRAKSIETNDNILDRVDNGWVFGVPLIHCKFGNLMITPKVDSGTVTIYQIDPKTVEQFTGLYDVENKPIYEGDIILTQAFTTRQNKKSKDYKEKRFYGVVEFETRIGNGFYNRDTGEYDKEQPISALYRVRLHDPKNEKIKYRYGVWDDFFDCRVVGNIYDNKELLEDINE